MMCALTDLSVQLYPQSPYREFLSGICNISHRSEQSHRNNNNNKTVFDMWRGCSDGFKTFGRTAGSSIAFHVLKEPRHSNGSSEALRCPPFPAHNQKGGRLCRPPPRSASRASISAALEDTAAALLAGSTLAISETSNPGATL